MYDFDMELTQAEVEQLEENKFKLTIQVSPEIFKQSLRRVYNQSKHHFNIPGFRKGKAPRMIIEQYYGKEVFYQDAIGNILDDAYAAALEKTDVDAVYRPDVSMGEVSEAAGITFFAEVYTRPNVTIEGYYGLTYPKVETEPTEDEIQAALRAEQDKNARQVSVDRAAAMGDVVNINFTGYVDDEAFEGGHGEFIDLTLGSGRFIPGFEDQLVGHVAGDDVKVEVTFPEDYSHTDLAGKPAVFEVEIVDVKEKQLPELDDDFAQDVSEFDTLAEYRADIAEKMRKDKESNLENSKRGAVMEKLAKLIVANVPEVMYTARLDDMMDGFRRQIESQGMDFENYLRFSGVTEAALRGGWQGQAKLDVDSMLALAAVADAENLDVTDEEFKEKFGEMSGMKDEELDKFIADMSPRRKKDLVRSMRCEKAMDFVLEKAIAVDEPFPVADDLIPVPKGDIIDAEISE